MYGFMDVFLPLHLLTWCLLRSSKRPQRHVTVRTGMRDEVDSVSRLKVHAREVPDEPRESATCGRPQRTSAKAIQSTVNVHIYM